MSTHAVPVPTGTAPRLDGLYRPVHFGLQAVERRLRRELRSRHAFVDELVRYGCLLGGKRLRPALVLLAGEAAGSAGRAHVTLATAVELIHTATLIHDDVLDEADTRRHLATINARWDTQTSVLLGDYLFTHAFHLASSLDSTFACRVIGRATNRVCEGELRQTGSRGDLRLSEQEYLEIIEAKTAELCAAACQLGAHYGGATGEAVQRLETYGRCLGIAFQIADDILDVAGAESEVGKSLGRDLEQQKPTLPLIRLLQVCNGSDRRQLLRTIEAPGETGREHLRQMLHRYGAVEFAGRRAAEYVTRAVRQLEGLPDSPSLQSLRGLARFVVARTA